MADTRPSRGQILTNLSTSIEARTGKSRVHLVRSPENLIANSTRDSLDLIHRRIDEASPVPDPRERAKLLQWAANYGLVPNPGTKSVGNVQFSKSGSGTIPVGAFMTNPAIDHNYVVTGVVSDIGNSITVSVESSVVGAFTAINSSIAFGNVYLYLASSYPDVQSTGSIEDPGIVGGTDAEGIEDFFIRFRNALASNSSGKARIEGIALGVAGITRAKMLENHYAIGHSLLVIASDGEFDSIPTAQMLEDVRNAVALAKSPSGIIVVNPVSPYNIEVRLASMNPSTMEAGDAVKRQIVDAFHRNSEFGGSISTDEIDRAIRKVPGYVSHVRTLPADGTYIASATQFLRAQPIPLDFLG